MGHHHEIDIIMTPDVMGAFSAVANEHTNEEGYSHSVNIPWARHDITTLAPITEKMIKTFSDTYYARRGERGWDDYYLAAPVLDERTITRRKVKVKVTVLPENITENGHISGDCLQQAAQAVAKRTGEILETWSVDSVKAVTKVITVTPKERAVTKYFAHEPRQNPNPLQLDWEVDGFATQAAARKAAVESLSRPLRKYEDRQREFIITPITRREGGAAMVSVKRVVTKATCEMEVVFAKSSDPSQTVGWAVAMECHH